MRYIIALSSSSAAPYSGPASAAIMPQSSSGREYLTVRSPRYIWCVFERRQRLFTPVCLQLTLPHRHAVPSHGGQLLLHPFVALPVAVYLGCPEVNVALWHLEILAPFMSMPEAAVHKNARAILAQHYIWMSRQARMIQPVSESARKQILPDYHLRLCVCRMYGGHVFVPLLLSTSVHPPPLFVNCMLPFLSGIMP